MGLNRTNALPIEQQVRIWERKLNQEAQLADPINMIVRPVYSATFNVHAVS